MTPQLIDLRYPFISFVEFISRDLFWEQSAIHLVAAWLGVIALVLAVFFFRPKFRAYESFAILSVVLAPYSNPAFHIIRLSPSDIFGLLTFGFYFSGLFSKEGMRKILPWDWMSFWALVGIHSLIVFCFYDLGAEREFLERLVLVSRPIISIVVAAVVGRTIFAKQANREKMFWISFGALSVAAIVYLIQMWNFNNGITPYGTMPSAGFGGVRFGGVSNEGGHLAKLSYPVLMILLLLVDSNWKWLCFAAVSVIFLLNVSATGYVVFALFVLTAFSLHILRLLKKLSFRTILTIIPLIIFGTIIVGGSGIGLRTSPVYEGLINKIDDAIDKARSPERDIYGRSPLIAKAIIEKFPLGIGYAGSTQRNIVMSDFDFVAKENNLGINVAIASWSFFSMAIFLFLSIKFILGWLHTSSLQKAAFLSLICLMAIDVIWANAAVYCALLLAVTPSCQVANGGKDSRGDVDAADF